MAKKSHQDTAPRPPEEQTDPVAPYRGRPEGGGSAVDKGEGYSRAVPEPESEGRRAAPESESVPDRHVQARQIQEQDRRGRITELDARDTNLQAAIGNSNSLQLNRRNAIADNLDRTADRAAMEDVAETEPQDAGIAEDSGDAATAAQEGEEAALAAGATASPIEDDESAGSPAERRYKLRINGRDVELTESEVIARAQKVASADEYLQTATEALKRVQAPTPPHEGVPANVEQDDVEETLTSALMGDKEAIKTIARRLQAPSGPTPDVLSAVDDRVSFRSAVDWFRSAYADVVDDPKLYRQVVHEEAELAQAQPALPYRDRLKSVGDSVRAWRDGLRGPAAPAAPPPNPKLTRKASVAPVPQASGRQVPPSEEEQDESVESVIDQMARARHQKAGAIRNGNR